MAERGTRANIDLTELERLCAIQATDEEIAGWFGVSTRTIERRRLEPEFAEVMQRGKAKGRISVRRTQIKIMEGGSAAMGIWLGRQLLGQVDQVSVDGNAQVVFLVLPRGVRTEPTDSVGPLADQNVYRQLAEASDDH